jgi:hypothetical protein
MYGEDLKQEYDENGDVKCEKCGGTYKEGDFPFCKGSPSDHAPPSGFDEAFTPYVDIQLLSRGDSRVDSVNALGIPGVQINSRSERRQLMKELGLQYGTQKFDEKRGKVLYGGQATSERFKSHQGKKRRQRPHGEDPRRAEYMRREREERGG